MKLGIIFCGLLISSSVIAQVKYDEDKKIEMCFSSGAFAEAIHQSRQDNPRYSNAQNAFNDLVQVSKKLLDEGKIDQAGYERRVSIARRFVGYVFTMSKYMSGEDVNAFAFRACMNDSLG